MSNFYNTYPSSGLWKNLNVNRCKQSAYCDDLTSGKNLHKILDRSVTFTMLFYSNGSNKIAAKYDKEYDGYIIKFLLNNDSRLSKN